MYSLLLSFFVASRILISQASPLPFIFDRAVNDTTSLAPTPQNVQRQLGPLLAKGASLYFPGTPQFQDATSRWSTYKAPNIAVVVEPGSAKDVATAISFANKFGIPYLAMNKGHGSTTTLGAIKNGIEIHVRSLNSITINADGKSASIGGGSYNQELINKLWSNGKASASGSCACVGLMGAGLGGGLGRYQGFYGLISDNLIDVDIVLASGETVTVSEKSNSDLWWGLRGAGHNFGIVTRFTMKIFDSPAQNWYFAQFVFTQDKLEQMVGLVNKMMNNGNQPKELMNYYLYAWNPAISTTEPVVIFTIYYIGTKEQAAKYTKPYFDLGPVFHNDSMVAYPELASATGLGDEDFSCAHGFNRVQYPVGLLNYNVSNTRAVYNLFKEQTVAVPALNLSTVVFEGYSLQGVKAVPAASTAYPHREDNILASILAVYAPNPSLDSVAIPWARKIRDLMHSGQPGRQLNAYVNYAFGDETQEMVYGYEPWRLERLRGLKKKYDPKGKFNFYEPIKV
ncbi:MAG: hypothetical protein L6R36_003013 [Xanthoria steineri]|nr:MAG: hypothetical protein L6R36_003013 [Xanthoria steineri]